MSQTVIIDETYDHYNGETGEIKSQVKHTLKKDKTEPTDQYIKVSKYLSTIFAFNGIPLKLVPISLLIAERMEFKTNKVFLLKPLKTEIANKLQVSLDRVNKLIKECQNCNIITKVDRGIYEVNSYLFSTGNTIDTRKLQADFDFLNNKLVVTGMQKNKITGETVRRAIENDQNEKKELLKAKAVKNG